jgi:aspartokinase/homoserine dehydrogenase 1
MTHALTADSTDHVDVILLGAGNIGRELLVQVGWASEAQSPLRICAVIDRSGYLFDPAGLTRRQVLRAVAQKSAGAPLAGIAGACTATPAQALAAIALRRLLEKGRRRPSSPKR